MEYKKSIFNVDIEKLPDGRKLIYNTYSGIFGIMDIKTQGIFNNIENFGSLDVDENEENNVSIMLKSGYIVDKETDELAALKLERTRARHPQDALNLTIAPTLDCNMRCPYCYENRSNLAMTEETQEQLVAFLKSQIQVNPLIKNVHVMWYGGEPLLHKNIIYSLSEKFIRYCTEREIKYTAAIITNGVLLDVKTAKRLADECKVSSTQITIDGMKETHNKRRLLMSGEGSWDAIIQNIDNSKSFLPISIRVNIDKDNICDVDSLTKHFIEEKGWTKNPQFYLAPVEDFSDSCLSGKSSCLEGGEFAEVNIECLRALYEANRESVASQFFPRRRPVFCAGEGLSNYIVDPEGFYSNCYVTIGSKEKRTGHISKPFLITREYGKWLLSDIPEECEQCEYLPMCMGGCGIYRIVNDNSPKCFKTYYTYKDVLKLAYEDYIKQKMSPKNELSKEERAAASL